MEKLIKIPIEYIREAYEYATKSKAYTSNHLKLSKESREKS